MVRIVGEFGTYTGDVVEVFSVEALVETTVRKMQILMKKNVVKLLGSGSHISSTA